MQSFPHTRGGGPYMGKGDDGEYPFSPHAWGWTYGLFYEVWGSGVFPTRVGVDRPRHIMRDKRRCFPHTRGGGPS